MTAVMAAGAIYSGLEALGDMGELECDTLAFDHFMAMLDAPLGAQIARPQYGYIFTSVWS